MRNINLSTDVYAAIWSKRQPGEETEDAILRRLFDVTGSATAPSEPVPKLVNGAGFKDDRNGVQFAEGFEIYRNYKGTTYRARATKGRWLLLNTNTPYSSLHKLSTAVVNGPENAWFAWRCQLPGGREGPINGLRDQSRVGIRL